MSIGKKLPRLVTWKDYGITRERLKELKKMCCLPENAAQTRCAAHRASEMLSEYILLSVKENLSYDDLEFNSRLGRIPCGRTDFYGYRRLFYHLLDESLKGEKDMEQYKVKRKKANSDYYISSVGIDYKERKYVAQIDTVNRVAECSARTCLESDNGKVLRVMIEALCDTFAPARGTTEESGTVYDFVGLMGGNDAKNA